MFRAQLCSFMQRVREFSRLNHQQQPKSNHHRFFCPILLFYIVCVIQFSNILFIINYWIINSFDAQTDLKAIQLHKNVTDYSKILLLLFLLLLKFASRINSSIISVSLA